MDEKTIHDAKPQEAETIKTPPHIEVGPNDEAFNLESIRVMGDGSTQEVEKSALESTKTTSEEKEELQTIERHKNEFEAQIPIGSRFQPQEYIRSKFNFPRTKIGEKIDDIREEVRIQNRVASLGKKLSLNKEQYETILANASDEEQVRYFDSDPHDSLEISESGLDYLESHPEGTVVATSYDEDRVGDSYYKKIVTDHGDALVCLSHEMDEYGMPGLFKIEIRYKKK